MVFVIKPKRIMPKVSSDPPINAKIFLDKGDGTDDWRYNGEGRLTLVEGGYEDYFKVYGRKSSLIVSIFQSSVNRVVKLRRSGLEVLFFEDNQTNCSINNLENDVSLKKGEELIIEVNGQLNGDVVRYRIRC